MQERQLRYESGVKTCPIIIPSDLDPNTIDGKFTEEVRKSFIKTALKARGLFTTRER